MMHLPLHTIATKAQIGPIFDISAILCTVSKRMSAAFTAKPEGEDHQESDLSRSSELVRATLANIDSFTRPFADAIRNIDTSFISAITEAGKHYHEHLQEAMKSIASIGELATGASATIQSISEGIITGVKSISEFTTPLNRSIQRMAETFRVDIDWLRYEREYRDAYSRFVRIFTECGWPPLLTIPARSIHEFIREYDNDPDDFQASIGDWVLRYCDESGLGEIETGWEGSSIIGERLPILRECIEGHRDGYYNLTVPTLLTQIEGLLCSAFEHVGASGGHVWRRYVDAIIENQTEYLPIREMIIERLLQRFQWGDPSAMNFSRHTILHGSSLTHGTKESSTKLILLVDVIVHLIERHFHE